MFMNGEWELNPRYQAIIKLHDLLTEANIPHRYQPLMDGYQVIYPEDGDNRIMDAIEHYDSYGQSNDLLEIMGLLTDEEAEHDEVVGYLTVEDVFNRIKKHWEAIA